MRKWVINNLDKGSSSLFTTIYELMYKSIEIYSTININYCRISI